jgi:hypothetical protein
VVTVMATTIRYEMKVCGRCGGSGSYSYCLSYGTTCFACKGSKKVLSAAGAKAAKAVKAFIADHHTVSAEALVAGDRITVDGKARTLASVTIDGTARYGSTVDGVTTWADGVTLTFTKPIPSPFGAYSTLGCPVGTKYVKGVAGADWDAVVAFAATLKKGVTLVDKAA